MSINFYGDARGEFRNTVVGEHATMTVYESADVREELDALLAAIRAERDLPPILRGKDAGGRLTTVADVAGTLGRFAGD